MPLYPTKADIHSLMIMFVYHLGLNVSVLNAIKVSDAQQVSAAGARRPIYVLRLDKPRRGRGE